MNISEISKICSGRFVRVIKDDTKPRQDVNNYFRDKETESAEREKRRIAEVKITRLSDSIAKKDAEIQKLRQKLKDAEEKNDSLRRTITRIKRIGKITDSTKSETKRLSDALQYQKDVVKGKDLVIADLKRRLRDSVSLNTYFSKKAYANEQREKNTERLPRVIRYNAKTKTLHMPNNNTYEIPEGVTKDDVETFIKTIFPNANFTLLTIGKEEDTDEVDIKKEEGLDKDKLSESRRIFNETRKNVTDSIRKSRKLKDADELKQDDEPKPDESDKEMVKQSVVGFANLMQQYATQEVQDVQLQKFVEENPYLPQVLVDLVENMQYGMIPVQFYNVHKKEIETLLQEYDVEIPSLQLLVEDSKCINRNELQRKLGDSKYQKVLDSIIGVPTHFILTRKRRAIQNEVQIGDGRFAYGVIK